MGTKNKMPDLRDHLFAALEGLMDKDDPLDIDRAKAVAEVSQVIINSARVEVDAMKLTKKKPEFIDDEHTLVAIDRPDAIYSNKSPMQIAKP